MFAGRHGKASGLVLQDRKWILITLLREDGYSVMLEVIYTFNCLVCFAVTMM